jgi:hypothetical protein
MPDTLIWSWTLEDNKSLASASGIPIWLEKIIAVMVCCVSIFILFILFNTILSPFLLYPALLLIIYIFYKIITKPVKTKSLESEAYIKIFTDGIHINLEGFYGFYKSDDIILETLKLDNIYLGNTINVWGIKGLCFTTIKHNMKLEVPLTKLMNQSRFELENIIDQLKSANKKNA